MSQLDLRLCIIFYIIAIASEFSCLDSPNVELLQYPPTSEVIKEYGNKFDDADTEKDTSKHNDVTGDETNILSIDYENVKVEGNQNVTSIDANDFITVKPENESNDSRKVIANDQDNTVSVYIAGSGDSIKKLKKNIQKCGEGHELLVYFYIYKNQKYYDLGCLHTDANILRRFITNFNNNFCIKTPRNKWCFDHISKYKQDFTTEAGFHKDLNEPVKFDSNNDCKLQEYLPIEVAGHYEFNLPNGKEYKGKDILNNVYQNDGVSIKNNNQKIIDQGYILTPKINNNKGISLANEDNEITNMELGINKANDLQDITKLRESSKIDDTFMNRNDFTITEKGENKNPINGGIEISLDDIKQNEFIADKVNRITINGNDAKIKTKNDINSMLSKPRTVLSNLLGKTDQSYLPLLSVESPSLPNQIPYKDVIKTPVNINIQSPFEAVVASDSDQAFNILQDNNVNNAEEIETMSHIPNEQALLNNNLNTDLSRTKYFVQDPCTYKNLKLVHSNENSFSSGNDKTPINYVEDTKIQSVAETTHTHDITKGLLKNHLHPHINVVSSTSPHDTYQGIIDVKSSTSSDTIDLDKSNIDNKANMYYQPYKLNYKEEIPQNNALLTSNINERAILTVNNNNMGFNTPNLPTSYHSHGDISYKLMNPNLKTIITKNGISKGNQDILSPEANPVSRENSIYPFNNLPQYKLSYLQIPLVSAYIPLKVNKAPKICFKHQGENIKPSNSKADLLEVGAYKELPIVDVSRDAPYQYSNEKNLDHQLKYNPAISKNIITLNEQDKTYVTPQTNTESSFNLGTPQDSFTLKPSLKVSINNVDLVTPSLPNENLENSMYSIDASKSNTEPLTYPTEPNASNMKYQTIEPDNNDNDSTLLNRIPVLLHNTAYTIPKPNTPMSKMQNIAISYVPITPSYQTTPIQNLNLHAIPKVYANSFMTKTEEEIRKEELESKYPNMINFYNKNIQSWLKGFPMYQMPGQRILNYNEIISSTQDSPKLSSKIQNVPDYTAEENHQLDYTESGPQAINSQTMSPGFVLYDNKNNNIKNQVSPDYSALQQNPKYNFGDFYKLQPKYFKIPSPVPVTTSYLQPRPNIRYSPLNAIKLLPIEPYTTNLNDATIHVKPLNEMSTEVHVQPLSILRNMAHAIPKQNIIPKSSNYLLASSNLPSIYQSNSIPIQSVQNTYLNGPNNYDDSKHILKYHLHNNQNTLTNGFRAASIPESAEIESSINKNMVDLNENYIDNGLKGQTLQQPSEVKYDERISSIGVNPILYSLKQLPEYLRIKNINPVEKNPNVKNIYSPDINKNSIQDSVIYYDEKSNNYKLTSPGSSPDEKLFSNMYPQKLPERNVQENQDLMANVNNMVEYQAKKLNNLDQDQYNMNPFNAPKFKQNYIQMPLQLVNQKYLGLLQQQQPKPTIFGTIFPNSLITKIKPPSYLQHQDNSISFTPHLTEFKKPQIPYLSKGTQYSNIYNSLKPLLYKTVDPDMKKYDMTSTPTIYENIYDGISTVGSDKGTNIKQSLNMNGPSNYLYFNQPTTDLRNTKTLDSVLVDTSEQNKENKLDSSFDLKGEVYEIESSNPENPTISSSYNILPEETLTTSTIKDGHKNINPNIIKTPIKYMYWPVKFKNDLNLAKNIAVQPEPATSSTTQPSATFYTPINPTYKLQTVYTEAPTPPSNRVNLYPNNLSPAEIYYENFSQDSNHQANNVHVQQPSPILLNTKTSNQNIPISNLYDRLINANYLTSPVTSINPSAHNYLNGYTFNMIYPKNVNSNKSKQDIFSIPFNANYISYGLDNLSYSFKQEKPISTVTSGNPTVNPFSNGRSYFTEYTPIPQSASSAPVFDSQFTKANKNQIKIFYSSTPKSINNFVPIKSITESTNPLTGSIKSDRLLQNINPYNTITQNTGAFQTNVFPILLPPSIRQTNLDSVPMLQNRISFTKRAPILPLLDFSSENEPHSSISNKTSPTQPNIGLANFGTSYSLQGEYSVPQINSHAYSISQNIPERFEVHKKSYPTQIEPISIYSPARSYRKAFNIADKNYYSAISDNNNLQSRFGIHTHNRILSQIKNLSPTYVSYKTIKPYLNGQFADLNYAFTLKTKPSVDASNKDAINQIYQITSPSLNLPSTSSYTIPIPSSTPYKTPSLDASKMMIENGQIQNISNKKNMLPLQYNLLNVQSDNILSTFNPKSMNNAGIEYILLQPQRETATSTPTELITRTQINQNQPKWQTPLVLPSQSPWSKITSQPWSYPPDQWDFYTKSVNFDPLTQYTNSSYNEASRNSIWDYIIKQQPMNYAASPGPFLVTQSHGQPDNQQLKYDLKEYKPASLTSNVPISMIDQNTDNLKSINNFEDENALQQLQKRIEYYLPTSLASIGNKELETQLNDYNLKDVQSWSPNIVIAKYEPSLSDSFVIKTDDSGVELKAWRSKIKVFKPRIVYDVKEVSSLNFMPVVRNSKYTVETAMELARGYVTRTYGNPIVIKGVYSFWKPYAMINYNSNIIRNDMPLLWPTFCSCGCCKSGCNYLNQ